LGKFLFGSSSTEKDSDQIVIAMIPHIVRTPDYSPENLRGIYAGTDQNIRVKYLQADEPVPAAPAAVPGAPAPPAAAKPDGTAPQAAAPQAKASSPASPNPAPAASTSPGARLSFQQGAVQAARNGTFTLTMQLEGGSSAVSFAPLQIKFDPAQLHLNSAAAGDLLTHDGGLATTEKDIRNDAGEASLTFTRLPGAGAVSGTGAVATLTFSAIGKGKGTVSITAADLKNSQAQSLPVLLGSVPVTVE
jgi:hypothetical protein